VLALVLNALVLGSLSILLAAALGALRTGLRQKARFGGLLLVFGVALASLLLIIAVLI
jgi:hypothetical protein